MTAVLLAPHSDDEALFAAFLALEHQPDLIVCTRGDVQGERGLPITAAEREAETDAAWEILSPGRDWTQWQFTDNPLKTQWGWMATAIGELPARYDLCIAPAWEAGGHEHHNHVGHYALEAFGAERTIRYLTYRRGGPRSTDGREVEIKHPDWIVAKLRALACYVSQIREPTTRPWFLEPLTEFVAP